MPTCFVAHATGQMLANVAPLLALARPEDCIVFIDTPEAQRQRWSEPALNVLRRHGHAQLHVLALHDDQPATLRNCLRAFLSARPADQMPCLLANGGTKLHSLMLWEALRQFRPNLAYSLDKPCAIEKIGQIDDTWAGLPPAQRQPYPPTPLMLQDVLALRRMQTSKAGPGLCLFEHGALTSDGNHCATDPHPYGREQQFTLDLHQRHHTLAAKRRAQPWGSTALPRWDDLQRIDAKAADKFRRAFSTALGIADASNPALGPRVGPLYNAAVSAARKATFAAATGSEGGGSPLPEPIGPAFERALRRRLCHLLAARPAWIDILQSVHANVKIEAEARAGIVTFEADILLLLRNGVLLAIEAKSHDASSKDLDARLLNLQRLSTQLARIAVCAPLYSAAAKLPSARTWFASHHELAQRLESTGLPHLPFELPGQAPSYLWPPSADASAAAAQQRHEAGHFADALRALLDPYQHLGQA